VASPPERHAEHAVACLEAGIAVLVEKPLALSLHDANRVVEAGRLAGLPVLVGQNFRFLPREQAVRRLLAARAIGEATAGVVISARPAWVVRPHLSAIPFGPLWDICLHHLDAVRSRFEVAADSVMARATEDAPGSLVSIRLEWRQGFSLAYHHAERAPSFYYHEWVSGPGGMIEVDGERVRLLRGGQTTRLRRPSRWPRRIRTAKRPPPEAVLLAELRAALAGGPRSQLDAEDNLWTVAIVEAAVLSARRERRVHLSEVAERAEVPLLGSERADG
jgi:predicted dehydrogenase